MATARLFDLLAALRSDQINREVAWEEAIQARAKFIAENEKKCLPTEEAYESFKYRAEAELKSDDAPEWRRVNPAVDGDDSRPIWEKLDETFNRGYQPLRVHPGSPWQFVVYKLKAERGMPFDEGELFTAVLFVRVGKAADVDPAIRRFVADQDDSGYTNELLGELWRVYRSDAERLGLPRAGDPPPGCGPRDTAAGKGPAKKAARRRKREKRTIPTPKESRALELKARGFTGPQIAHEMNITPGRVSQLLKSGAKRSGQPSRSIDLSKAVPLMDHDGAAPKSKKRTRPLNDH